MSVVTCKLLPTRREETMAIFDEIQAGIEQVAEGAGASVVGIGHRWGAGSGIVLGDGQVLTNAHNIRAGEGTVTFPAGRTPEGRLAGCDIDASLAVVAVDTGGVGALPWVGEPAA